MEIYIASPPADVAADLAKRLRTRRLARNLTQEGLARRSGVALGTLKKFERSGATSLVSFIRMVVALGKRRHSNSYWPTRSSKRWTSCWPPRRRANGAGSREGSARVTPDRRAPVGRR